jgi:hypothetical protein
MTSLAYIPDDMEADARSLLYLVQDFEDMAAHSPGKVRRLVMDELKEASDRLCALVGKLEDGR